MKNKIIAVMLSVIAVLSSASVSFAADITESGDVPVIEEAEEQEDAGDEDPDDDAADGEGEEIDEKDDDPEPEDKSPEDDEGSKEEPKEACEGVEEDNDSTEKDEMLPAKKFSVKKSMARNTGIKVNGEDMDIDGMEETDSGTSMGLSWTIYDDSVLVVSGTQSSQSGDLTADSWGWNGKRNGIEKIIVCDGISVNNAGSMFCNMPNVESIRLSDDFWSDIVKGDNALWRTPACGITVKAMPSASSRIKFFGNAVMLPGYMDPYSIEGTALEDISLNCVLGKITLPDGSTDYRVTYPYVIDEFNVGEYYWYNSEWVTDGSTVTVQPMNSVGFDNTGFVGGGSLRMAVTTSHPYDGASDFEKGLLVMCGTARSSMQCDDGLEYAFDYHRGVSPSSINNVYFNADLATYGQNWLKNIGVDTVRFGKRFDCSNVTDFLNFFYSAYIKTLDMTGFDMGNANPSRLMNNGTTKILKIIMTGNQYISGLTGNYMEEGDENGTVVDLTSATNTAAAGTYVLKYMKDVYINYNGGTGSVAENSKVSLNFYDPNLLDKLPVPTKNGATFVEWVIAYNEYSDYEWVGLKDKNGNEAPEAYKDLLEISGSYGTYSKSKGNLDAIASAENNAFYDTRRYVAIAVWDESYEINGTTYKSTDAVKTYAFPYHIYVWSDGTMVVDGQNTWTKENMTGAYAAAVPVPKPIFFDAAGMTVYVTSNTEYLDAFKPYTDTAENIYIDEIIIEDGVKTITNSFGDPENVGFFKETELDIPASVTDISGSFVNHTELSEITGCEGVTSLNDETFSAEAPMIPEKNLHTDSFKGGAYKNGGYYSVNNYSGSCYITTPGLNIYWTTDVKNKLQAYCDELNAKIASHEISSWEASNCLPSSFSSAWGGPCILTLLYGLGEGAGYINCDMDGIAISDLFVCDYRTNRYSLANTYSIGDVFSSISYISLETGDEASHYPYYEDGKWKIDREVWLMDETQGGTVDTIQIVKSTETKEYDSYDDLFGDTSLDMTTTYYKNEAVWAWKDGVSDEIKALDEAKGNLNYGTVTNPDAGIYVREYIFTDISGADNDMLLNLSWKSRGRTIVRGSYVVAIPIAETMSINSDGNLEGKITIKAEFMTDNDFYRIKVSGSDFTLVGKTSGERIDVEPQNDISFIMSEAEPKPGEAGAYLDTKAIKLLNSDGDYEQDEYSGVITITYAAEDISA